MRSLLSAIVLSVLCTSPPAAATIKWTSWVAASATTAIGVIRVCDGSVRVACDGSVTPAAGSVVPADGSVSPIAGDGSVLPAGTRILAGDGSVKAGDGSVLVGLTRDEALSGDGSVKPGDGSVVIAHTGGVAGGFPASSADGGPLLLTVAGEGSVRTLSLGAKLYNPFLFFDVPGLDVSFAEGPSGPVRFAVLDPADGPATGGTLIQLLGGFENIGWRASRPDDAPIGYTFGIGPDAFVPLPAAGWLALGGVAALLGLSRHRNSAAQAERIS